MKKHLTETDTGAMCCFFVCLFVLFCFALFCLFACLLFCFVFRDRVSLCSPGCPGTHSVDQAGLELRNLPASASQVLRLRSEEHTPSEYQTTPPPRCLKPLLLPCKARCHPPIAQHAVCRPFCHQADLFII